MLGSILWNFPGDTSEKDNLHAHSVPGPADFGVFFFADPQTLPCEQEVGGGGD